MKGIDIGQLISDKMEEFANKDINYRRFKTSVNPKLSRSTQGYEQGMYLFTAEPNGHKSALMQTIGLDIAINNPSTRLLVLTLDDSAEIAVKRFISCYSYLTTLMNGKKPTKIGHVFMGEKLKATQQENLHYARQKIIEMYRQRRLVVADKTHVKSISKLVEFVEANKPDGFDITDLVLCIDSPSSLFVQNIRSKLEKDDILSTNIKQLSVDYNCPVFVTVHKKKSDPNAKGQPVSFLDQEDIKGSQSWSYESNFSVSLQLKDKKKFLDNAILPPDQRAEGYRDISCMIIKNKITEAKGSFILEGYGEYSVAIEKEGT